MEKLFELQGNRLMLSLGTLSEKKYCTYSCPFCYLHSPKFESFPSYSPPEIVEKIKKLNLKFDIIYISGDTDSFAPPRTNTGLDLLEALTEFNVDLLFTTRAPFAEEHYEKFQEILRKQTAKGKLLIGCISVSQLNHPHLEPSPIPSPEFRIEQLKRLKDLGLVSVLALRPFLPVVPLEDYLKIIEMSKKYVDIVLGSHWYADEEGIMEKGVFKNQTKSVNSFIIEKEQMDFDVNLDSWKVYKCPKVVKQTSKYCAKLNIPFFMRSKPAIEWIRRRAIQMEFSPTIDIAS